MVAILRALSSELANSGWLPTLMMYCGVSTRRKFTFAFLRGCARIYPRRPYTAEPVTDETDLRDMAVSAMTTRVDLRARKKL